MERSIPTHFDPRGFLDTFLPGFLFLLLLGQAYKHFIEKPYIRKPSKLTYVSFVGFVSRLLLLLELQLPYPILRRRWDMIMAIPTMYELVMHMYHYNDTGANFKRFFLTHHLTALLVLWPAFRLFEATPYPVSCLTFALMFEVGSSWSYWYYVFERTCPDLLSAAGLHHIKPQDAMAANHWLCFVGQRAMRWYSLLVGGAFAFANTHTLPFAIPCMLLPSLAFECIGLHTQWTHLPEFPTQLFVDLAHTTLTKGGHSSIIRTSGDE